MEEETAILEVRYEIRPDNRNWNTMGIKTKFTSLDEVIQAIKHWDDSAWYEGNWNIFRIVKTEQPIASFKHEGKYHRKAPVPM